jgi:hypothetical protein
MILAGSRPSKDGDSIGILKPVTLNQRVISLWAIKTFAGNSRGLSQDFGAH